MKKLIFMRHAKSDWSSESLSDYDRPLNDRGLQDAQKMGKEMNNQDIIPDLILCSPAKRAITTAKLFAESNSCKAEIKQIKDFYFGGTTDIIHEILNTNNTIKTLMIVGHNPTIEEAVASYSIDSEYFVMKTATITVLKTEVLEWNNLLLNSCEVELYLKPKDLQP